MKTIYTIFFLLIGFAAQANCKFHEDKNTNTIFVLPIYEAKVMYHFDNKDKQAFASILVAHHSKATSDCFEEMKLSNPDRKVKFNQIRVTEMKATVLKGLGSVTFNIYPEAGGFYNASSGYLEVDYKGKSEIINAINNKMPLVKMESDAYYAISSFESTVIGQIKCHDGSTKNGVLSLHKRLSQIINQLSSRTGDEKVDQENLLDQFMTSCVKFENIEATSFVGLYQSLRKTSLVDGEIPLIGKKETYKLHQTEAFSLQDAIYSEF